jgi:hypothetical protein
MYTKTSRQPLYQPFPLILGPPPPQKKNVFRLLLTIWKDRWLCEGSSVVTWYKEGQVLSADSFLVLQVSRPTCESSYRWVVLQVSRPTGESSYRWVVLQVSLLSFSSPFWKYGAAIYISNITVHSAKGCVTKWKLKFTEYRLQPNVSNV